MSNDLGYRVRKMANGEYICLHPDGLTWMTLPTNLMEAGRVCYDLNNDITPDSGDGEIRLLAILDKLAGPYDVRLETREKLASPAPSRVFDHMIA